MRNVLLVNVYFINSTTQELDCSTMQVEGVYYDSSFNTFKNKLKSRVGGEIISLSILGEDGIVQHYI